MTGRKRYVANTHERQEKLIRRLEEIDTKAVEWLCAVERTFGLGTFSYEVFDRGDHENRS